MESNQKNTELVYGMLNGRLTHISSVESGLRCECHCPHCEAPLVAKKGEINAHHFAHLSDAICDGAPETALHLFAKSLLAEEKKLIVPHHKLGSTLLTLDEVFVEPDLIHYRPDLQAHMDGELIDIEIKVTHGIEESKRDYVLKSGITMLEIDLSKVDRDLNPVELREAILFSAPRNWVAGMNNKYSNSQLSKFFHTNVDELSFDGRSVLALGYIDATGFSIKNNSEFEKRQLIVAKPIQSKGSRNFHISSSKGFDVELLDIGEKCIDYIEGLAYPAMLDLTFEPVVRMRRKFPKVLLAKPIRPD